MVGRDVPIAPPTEPRSIHVPRGHEAQVSAFFTDHRFSSRHAEMIPGFPSPPNFHPDEAHETAANPPPQLPPPPTTIPNATPKNAFKNQIANAYPSGIG